MLFKTRLKKIYYYKLGLITVKSNKFKSRGILLENSTCCIPADQNNIGLADTKKHYRAINKKLALLRWAVNFFSSLGRIFYPRRFRATPKQVEYSLANGSSKLQKILFKSKKTYRYSKGR